MGHYLLLPGKFIRLSIATCIFYVTVPFSSAIAEDPPVGLFVEGIYANAIVGSWPVNSTYSWVRQTLWNGGMHSWRMLPGTDGGIIFNKAQDQDAMIDAVYMFNVYRHLFTVNDGIRINPDLSIDMANLRILSDTGGAGTTTDHGSGSGYDTIVPKVANITSLTGDQNGWALETDGTFHLIYTTIAFCTTCKLKIHLYGTSMGLRDGDVTLDGVVDIGDLLAASRYVQGTGTLTAQQVARGDLYPAGGDGILNLQDSYLISRELFSAP